MTNKFSLQVQSHAECQHQELRYKRYVSFTCKVYNLTVELNAMITMGHRWEKKKMKLIKVDEKILYGILNNWWKKNQSLKKSIN